MVGWPRWLSSNPSSGRLRLGDGHVLPYDREPIAQSFPAREVTRVALRLKHQIEQVIPFEVEQERITTARSDIITDDVVATARTAGRTSASNDDQAQQDYSSCVVYCLLVCIRWFNKHATLEPWDSELHAARATACEIIARRLIESEKNLDYLLEDVLLKRYSTVVGGQSTMPANVIERAIDRHALRVIGSSGYQRCVTYLWRGWLVQDEQDPNRFISWKLRTSTSYWDHFDPDRLHVPRYQSIVQVAFSIIYLILFSIAVNSTNATGQIDWIEGLLYFSTLGFMGDEMVKIWKVGTSYIGFWNVFNNTLYGLVTVSFVMRVIALSFDVSHPSRAKFDVLSYDLLAFSAPMFWGRLLLYLDGYRFFGAMLIIVKVMMKESLIFFALLVVVWLGFLQAFIGLDEAEDTVIDASKFIIKSMANAIMGAADFGGFDRFAPPFGLILFYTYCFIIVVILLNVLVALYNSAYQNIYDNSTDEYLALFAMKTTQFVRAPDTNVYIPPLNIVEWLILPLEFFVSKRTYERVNDAVMGVLYAPLLLITAAYEVQVAKHVSWNRRRGEADDDDVQEWEQMADESGAHEDDDWKERVEKSRPDLAADALDEIKALRGEVAALKAVMETRGAAKGDGK